MLVYFEIPYIDKDGNRTYYPECAPVEIAHYAEENNLQILQISTYGTEGIYVLFKKLHSGS